MEISRKMRRLIFVGVTQRRGKRSNFQLHANTHMYNIIYINRRREWERRGKRNTIYEDHYTWVGQVCVTNGWYHNENNNDWHDARKNTKGATPAQMAVYYIESWRCKNQSLNGWWTGIQHKTGIYIDKISFYNKDPKSLAKEKKNIIIILYYGFTLYVLM